MPLLPGGDLPVSDKHRVDVFIRRGVHLRLYGTEQGRRL